MDDLAPSDFGFVLKPDDKEGGFLLIEIQKPGEEPFRGHLARWQATHLRDALNQALNAKP